MCLSKAQQPSLYNKCKSVTSGASRLWGTLPPWITVGLRREAAVSKFSNQAKERKKKKIKHIPLYHMSPFHLLPGRQVLTLTSVQKGFSASEKFSGWLTSEVFFFPKQSVPPPGIGWPHPAPLRMRAAEAASGSLLEMQNPHFTSAGWFVSTLKCEKPGPRHSWKESDLWFYK